MRAAIELGKAATGEPVKGEHIATAQGIPLKFLENILVQLRSAGIVRSQRGAEGGYWLARPAASVTVADLIRAVEGPLAAVRGMQPQALDYAEDTAALQRMWVSLRANLRRVLEHVTVADLAAGTLPAAVDALADDPDAWAAR